MEEEEEEKLEFELVDGISGEPAGSGETGLLGELDFELLLLLDELGLFMSTLG